MANFLANVMANQKSLNKLYLRVFAAAENGSVEVLSWWVYFTSRRKPSVLKTGRRFPYMLYLSLLRFFRKEKGKYTVTLIKLIDVL